MADDQASRKKKIAVIGAGCTGLAAALRLAKNGCDVTLFESMDKVGGLASGVTLNGNLYDYGPHLFHTTDPEILRDIKEIAGSELFVVNRTILIKFMGAYFKYPLSIRDALSKLPPLTVLKAGASFIYHNIKAFITRPKIRTSEDVLLNQYGKVLYELFFRSYIEHVWGIPPSEFSARFAKQRIPRVSAVRSLFRIVSALHKMFFKHVSTENYVENVEGVLYSTKRSFFGIAEKMALEIEKLGGKVRTSSAVRKIKKLDGGKFTVEAGSAPGAEVFDGVINTAPLSDLVDMLEPKPSAEIIRSAKSLKHRPVVFVGLLVNRPRVLPAAIMYYRELSFNRMIDLSYFGAEIVPPGCTQIIAEVACGKESRFWKDDKYSSETVVNELVSDNIIKKEEIKEYHVFRAEHAYPMFTVGFEDDLDRVFKELEKYGSIETAGRQGQFTYVNIHVALRMGYDAADKILKSI